MASYRISPTGVEAVLKKVQYDAEEFSTILKPLNGNIDAVAAATGGSGAIVPALESFFEQQNAHLDSINTRVGAALTGAYNATKAYVDGDLDMVTHYQTAASSSANLQALRGHGKLTVN